MLLLQSNCDDIDKVDVNSHDDDDDDDNYVKYDGGDDDDDNDDNDDDDDGKVFVPAPLQAMLPKYATANCIHP